MVYRKWLLRDVDRIPALLYLGATSRTQTVMRWSGELGCEGNGYMVARRGERVRRTTDRHSVTVGTALVVGPADRRIIEYAVTDPDGVIPRGTSSLAGKAWNMLPGAPLPITCCAPP